MHTFYYPLLVGSPRGGPSLEVEALVDTGSTYLWLPRSLVERLGCPVVGSRRVTVAIGEEIARDITPVNVTIGAETWPLPCLIGDDGYIPLCGAMVLEAFSLAPDPLNRRLIPVPSLALGSQ